MHSPELFIKVRSCYIPNSVTKSTHSTFQPQWIPIGCRIPVAVLIPVQSILNRIHRKPGTVVGIVEPRFRKVNVKDRVIDVTRKGRKYVVAVVVVQKIDLWGF